jgi:hypothetical protein
MRQSNPFASPSAHLQMKTSVRRFFYQRSSPSFRKRIPQMGVAIAILNSLVVLNSRNLDGQLFAVVSCGDFSIYKALPAAIRYNGQSLGLTGWNSDSGLAYYKTGQRFAVAL